MKRNVMDHGKSMVSKTWTETSGQQVLGWLRYMRFCGLRLGGTKLLGVRVGRPGSEARGNGIGAGS
jgi:hypothetical protein